MAIATSLDLMTMWQTWDHGWQDWSTWAAQGTADAWSANTWEARDKWQDSLQGNCDGSHHEKDVPDQWQEYRRSRWHSSWNSEEKTHRDDSVIQNKDSWSQGPETSLGAVLQAACTNLGMDVINCSDVKKQFPSSRPTKGRGMARHDVVPRLWCQLYLAKLHYGFSLVRKIIGQGGQNTKDIFEATGAKIRVRGEGSGHKEQDGTEAPAPLMVAVTSEGGKSDMFCKAVQMTINHLNKIHEAFLHHCHQRLVPKVFLSEGLWRFGDMCPEAAFLLSDLLKRLPEGQQYTWAVEHGNAMTRSSNIGPTAQDFVRRSYHQATTPVLGDPTANEQDEAFSLLSNQPRHFVTAARKALRIFQENSQEGCFSNPVSRHQDPTTQGIQQSWQGTALVSNRRPGCRDAPRTSVLCVPVWGPVETSAGSSSSSLRWQAPPLLSASSLEQPTAMASSSIAQSQVLELPQLPQGDGFDMQDKEGSEDEVSLQGDIGSQVSQFLRLDG